MNILLLRGSELRELEKRHAAARPPLMERAGRAAADHARQLLQGSRAPVLILAGPGNNGGDARVMARVLQQRGVAVVLVGPGNAVPDGKYGLIVNGLFGIGLGRPVEGAWADLIARINAFAGPVLALDIPSGLDGDTGRVLGVAVRATHTLSFIGGKPGLYTLDGPDHCGHVSVVDLGLRLDKFPGALLAVDDFRECLIPRSRNSHKGSYGSLAVIGGAAGMTGAALLAARAGLKLGAGRVFVGLLQAIAVDPLQPELMLRSADDALAQATTVVVGPGLGDSDAAVELLRRVASADFSLLLDADALNLLAAHPVLAARVARRSQATLITPHPAEAARLLSLTTEAVQADRVGAALELAQRYQSSRCAQGLRHGHRPSRRSLAHQHHRQPGAGLGRQRRRALRHGRRAAGARLAGRGSFVRRGSSARRGCRRTGRQRRRPDRHCRRRTDPDRTHAAQRLDRGHCLRSSARSASPCC